MTHNYFIRNLAFAMAFLVVGMSACKKDNLETKSGPETVGVYVLHEGVFPTGNSGIDYYDIKTSTVSANHFRQVNGYNLGKNPVQLKQYGNKIYCVVSGTSGAPESFLEVLDPSTLKSLKRIPFFKDKNAYLPRSIAFSGNKAYVAGFDGFIRRIDTASLTIDKEVNAGRALEGLAITNGKIYASNSDLAYLGLESTVSVVDLNSFTKLKEIEVGSNPTRLELAPDGNIFVTVQGVTGGTPMFKKIDAKTDVVSAALKIQIGALAIMGNAGYAVVDPYGLGELKTFNTMTGQIGNNFVTDTTTVTMPYGITINSLNGDVLVADALSYTPTHGMAFWFKSDGTLLYKFKTGQYPQEAVFIYK